MQFSKTSPLKSGESSKKSSGENRVKSCHVCGCHGFFGPERSFLFLEVIFYIQALVLSLSLKSNLKRFLGEFKGSQDGVDRNWSKSLWGQAPRRLSLKVIDTLGDLENKMPELDTVEASRWAMHSPENFLVIFTKYPELSGVIRAIGWFARFVRIGWFARIGNSSDSGESAWRAIKIGASIANDSRESFANCPCHKDPEIKNNLQKWK